MKKLTKKQMAKFDQEYEKRERETPKHFKFGGFGAHELMDRSELVMNLWNEYVVEHPRAQMTPQLDKLARQISGLMFDMFNMSSIAQCYADYDKQSWDLSHLDAVAYKQIAEYDAEKALREKWNDSWTDKDKEKLLEDAERLRKKEERKDKRDRKKAAEMGSGA